MQVHIGYVIFASLACFTLGFVTCGILVSSREASQAEEDFYSTLEMVEKQNQDIRKIFDFGDGQPGKEEK